MFVCVACQTFIDHKISGDNSNLHLRRCLKYVIDIALVQYKYQLSSWYLYWTRAISNVFNASKRYFAQVIMSLRANVATIKLTLNWLVVCTLAPTKAKSLSLFQLSIVLQFRGGKLLKSGKIKHQNIIPGILSWTWKKFVDIQREALNTGCLLQSLNFFGPLKFFLHQRDVNGTIWNKMWMAKKGIDSFR